MLVSVAVRDSEPSDVDTLAELQALVSLQVLRVWASDTAPIKTAAVPTADDYERVGVRRTDATGTAVALTAADVAALNSFVDGRSDVNLDSFGGEVQRLATAAFNVLNEANGANPDADTGINPTGADFATLGVPGVAGDAAAVLHTPAARLLADVVSTRNVTQLDTLEELNGLASAVDGVTNVASGASGSSLTLSDMSLLGISGSNSQAVANLLTVPCATPSRATSKPCPRFKPSPACKSCARGRVTRA